MQVVPSYEYDTVGVESEYVLEVRRFNVSYAYVVVTDFASVRRQTALGSPLHSDPPEVV